MIPAEEGECTSWWDHVVDGDTHVATEKIGVNVWSTGVRGPKENKWVQRWIWRTYDEAMNGHEQVVGWLEGKNERPPQGQAWQHAV